MRRAVVALFLIIAPAAYANEHLGRDRPLRVGGVGVAPGVSEVQGPGAVVRRFAVEVDRRLSIAPEQFAAEVEAILFARSGWLGPGSRIALQRVDTPPYNFRVTLAAPYLVDRLCHPLPTRGRVSCENRGRAVINSQRWLHASPEWPKRVNYRRYLINHEVGHSLGHDHRFCPRAGAVAPVMQQQTGGAGACRRGQWPKRFERAATHAPHHRYGALDLEIEPLTDARG